MSTPDENDAKTDTRPLLDAAQEDEKENRQAAGEPRHAGQVAMEQALRESGRTAEDLTSAGDEDGERAE
ncbi:hypothetical protein MF672_032425 [Actinomadura sp. ATCC 31491]|uniref:Uncharacterized protein n=1 Tax=Actinomadura luzonensis TaxID=2805427 RepID=A0ABT0G1P6_9ACTN|nr:hypothetical protein [Actinomadura luzonensis]MCK2218467.1 hypothetical protein [Actinomadura luzonensis]